MTDQALRAALLKLRGKNPLPASQFTPAQRSALDRFARKTGAVRCQRQGRGDVYAIRDQVAFDAHLVDLSPQVEPSLAEQLPLRAQHVAHARDSKARRHQHGSYYPLLKAVGCSVNWCEGKQEVELPLSTLTRDFGAATLCLQQDDAWHTEQALWLVENQALFDRTDWLPEGTQATLLYYGGQLDGRLLSWLGQRPRASRVILFPDYDGVGLSNFARLREALGDACDFWLMPQWERKLARYGSVQLWRDTLRHFSGAVAYLPASLRELTVQMQNLGLALEQEAVWLPAL
ncbi:DUF7281 domain-containing protein [Chitinimonas koreensis]|uniref:DUF7281 domain-containing protein n=1 Tax=Chitinimonas koreensis TaxID=356302 RepID=UPI0003FA92EC|nr:hypothetical protein [Chitinimonas koreensis]QNM97103.1 hypothetical protein H9L41_01855 [Chitinimonas koreensis]